MSLNLLCKNNLIFAMISHLAYLIMNIHFARSKMSAKSSRKSDGIDREPSEENIVIEHGEVDFKDSAESESKVRSDSAKRTVSRVSEGSRTSTPQYLIVPEQDIRPDRLILSSEEAMVDLRKRDREALKNSVRHAPCLFNNEYPL
jgi:hypothetical protein